MAEWTADLYVRDRRVKRISNGREPIDIVFEAEEWVRLHPEGKALVRWAGGDRKVHYIVRVRYDGEMEIHNTRWAKWPIFIPEGEGIIPFPAGTEDVEPEEGDNGGSGGNGEGEGEMNMRIFSRLFDGKRWRKAALGSTENWLQQMRAEFGVIDEEQAERYGENSARARKRLAMVNFKRVHDAGKSELRIRLPRLAKDMQIDIQGRWVVIEFNDEEIPT